MSTFTTYFSQATSTSLQTTPLPGRGVKLLLPENDISDPDFSIVVPAMNEEVTISKFVEWCKTGIAATSLKGEILIIDSSTDSTPELALKGGARVLRVPKRGLGRAYIDALPFIRGKYVLLGDCDCTYDFRNIAPFLEALKNGAEFVMGSRFRGSIEPGAMPALHRYFGTPITNWILNLIYSSKFTDIHCGMRGLTLNALREMALQSQSWEYASEMVLKSVHMKLKFAEVPISFFKDQKGRESHHKRSGWFSPWHAGWINLRAMFVYGADFFLVRPGWILTASGTALTLACTLGPVNLGPIVLSLFWQIFGLAAATLGMSSLALGKIAQLIYLRDKEKRAQWLSTLSYNRTTLVSIGLAAVGLGLTLPLVSRYFTNEFRLETADLSLGHLALSGLLLATASFILFTFGLVAHALNLRLNENASN